MKVNRKVIPLAMASLMLIIISSGTAKAQCSSNVCTPLNETFGTTAGCTSSSAQNVSSSYVKNMTFVAGSTNAPSDGQYGIRCNSGPQWQGGWETTGSGITDGSGTVDGNYLVVNAGYTGDSYGAYHPYEFYHRNVTQLCPGAIYNISFKMANLSTYSAMAGAPDYCGYGGPVEIQSWVMPSGSAVQVANSTSPVYDGSAGTQIYKTSTSDWYCDVTGFQWNTYAGTFSPSGTSFDLVLVSGYVRSAGDDFLIDDIVVTYAGKGTSTGMTCTTPVELISFTAGNSSQNVVLNWSTAFEKNNDYFAVERSVDGVHFEQIGTVRGNGNSNGTNYYTFSDYSFHNEAVYYRLKQVDFDGKYEYSKVTYVNIDGTNPVMITNDPSSSQAFINFYQKGEASFTIVDMLGKVVYNGKRESDEPSIPINKSMLCCGFYVVKVQMGSEVISKKIVLN